MIYTNFKRDSRMTNKTSILTLQTQVAIINRTARVCLIEIKLFDL